jgi:hypothetical protein
LSPRPTLGGSRTTTLVPRPTLGGSRTTTLVPRPTLGGSKQLQSRSHPCALTGPRIALFKLYNPRHPALLACPHWTGRRRINSPHGMSCLTTLAVKKTAHGAIPEARNTHTKPHTGKSNTASDAARRCLCSTSTSKCSSTSSTVGHAHKAKEIITTHLSNVSVWKVGMMFTDGRLSANAMSKMHSSASRDPCRT